MVVLHSVPLSVPVVHIPYLMNGVITGLDVGAQTVTAYRLSHLEIYSIHMQYNLSFQNMCTSQYMSLVDVGVSTEAIT